MEQLELGQKENQDGKVKYITKIKSWVEAVDPLRLENVP